MVLGWDSVRSYARTYKIDVYNSVYGFDPQTRRRNINRIVIDIDSPMRATDRDEELEERIRKANEVLSNYRRTIVFSGNGFHVYIHTKPCPEDGEHSQGDYLRGADSQFKADILGNVLDTSVYLSPVQMIRTVGTRHGKTNLYCVSVPSLEGGVQGIKEIAKFPSGKIHVIDGDLYEWPSPVRRRKEILVDVKHERIRFSSYVKKSFKSLVEENDHVCCPFVERDWGTRELATDKISNYEMRFWFLLFLRDCLLMNDSEASEVCGQVLSDEQIEKINRKGQMKRVFGHLEYHFNCVTLRSKGICSNECRCDYYRVLDELLTKIARKEVSVNAASSELEKIKANWAAPCH